MAMFIARRPAGILSPLTDASRIVTPAALPTMPSAGGFFYDPTFGNVKIYRITDASDGTGVGGTSYVYWSTANKDTTLLLVSDNNSTSGAFFRAFNPTTGALGSKYTVGTSGLRLDMASWSRLNAAYLYVPAASSPKIYQIDFTNPASPVVTVAADFSGVGGVLSTDYLWQVTMSDDDDVFAATLRASSDGSVKGWVAVRRSTVAVIAKVAPPAAGLDEVGISRDGTYVQALTSGMTPKAVIYKLADLSSVSVNDGSPDFWVGHYDSYGTVGVVGANDYGQVVARSLASPAGVTTLFDYTLNSDFTSPNHVSMRADDQSQAYVEHYGTTFGTKPLQGEMVTMPVSGSGAIKRWFMHYSVITDYNSQPRSNPSRDGRWWFFSSNMGVSGGRVDMWAAQLPSTP